MLYGRGDVSGHEFTRAVAIPLKKTSSQLPRPDGAGSASSDAEIRALCQHVDWKATWPFVPQRFCSGLRTMAVAAPSLFSSAVSQGGNTRKQVRRKQKSRTRSPHESVS